MGQRRLQFPFVRAFIISTTSHHLSFLFFSFLVFFLFFLVYYNPYISSKFWSTVFSVVLISLHGFNRSLFYHSMSISDPTKIQKIFVNLKILETEFLQGLIKNISKFMCFFEPHVERWKPCGDPRLINAVDLIGSS